MLLIKEAAISLKWNISAIFIGAAGALIVNAIRIASICIVTIKTDPEAAQVFHSSY
jgi:exosortase/archaeosortase family protein